MSSNPFRIYTENYRNNLPNGVTFDPATANYFFNGKRFPAIFLVEWYRQYLFATTGFTGGFDPAVLFANNEPGVWYDPSDLDTLFQDAAGTTPVTTPGQTVALMLDKSGNDFPATQATAAARPTYGIVPETGLRNLLTYTEDFSNAGWIKTRSTVSQIDGPTWLMTATDADARLEQLVLNFSPSQPRTFAVDVRAQSGTVAGAINISGTSQVSFVATTEFQRIETTWDTPLSGGYRPRIIINTVGDVLEIRFPQLEDGSIATGYQRVGSQYDVTEAGVTSLPYLFDDQVDDALLATIPDLGTDATIAYATDAGTTILTGQTIGAGSFDVLRGLQTYAVLAVNRPLTSAETAGLTSYLDAKRGA